MILAFLAVVLTVTAGIHLYLWKRLVRDTTTPGRWRRVGTIATFGVVVLLFVGLFGGRGLPRSVAQWVAWPGYLWLAIMFYLMVTLIVLEVPRLVLRLTWARRGGAAAAVREPALVGASASDGGAGGSGAHDPGPVAEAPDPAALTRRLLLARGVAVAAGATAVSLTGYGVTQAMGPPKLDRIRFPMPKLPARMDGLRIAVVSDIHLGPLLGRSHTQRIVDTINSVNPDIVAVVGDLVDGTVEELGPAAAPLRQIRARHGTYFVTGNHEYFSGYEPWIAEVGDLGLRVLQNERVEIDGLDLAGVNDIAGGQFGHGPDFGRTLGDRDRSKPVVLLAHQPVQAEEAAGFGVDLQLSGHTHGGQIVPFNLIVALEQPLISGLGTVKGVPVYVTNGAGFWGPPVRVGAPPQVSVVELRSA